MRFRRGTPSCTRGRGGGGGPAFARICCREGGTEGRVEIRGRGGSVLGWETRRWARRSFTLVWSAVAAAAAEEAALDGKLPDGFRNFGWRFLGMWWPSVDWAGGRSREAGTVGDLGCGLHSATGATVAAASQAVTRCLLCANGVEEFISSRTSPIAIKAISLTRETSGVVLS